MWNEYFSWVGRLLRENSCNFAPKAMLRIKRLYLFMLQSFVPLFGMTFFICLFIVLMQFLWRYIDDLVGKGLGMDVIGELFFYAALTMIPMALPLAILLASLMTFGNLGERFELTAMKASGVSLLRCMRPLIVLMAFIAVGAFFFQNNVLPIAQTTMWTLLYSMRQKSPEVEIPEGIFYDQIPGYNLFVQSKNRDTGILYDMMIYDMSKGFDNASIILADSGKLAFTEDKTHLYLKLWQGESFENLRDAGTRSSIGDNVPYRRESFTLKELVVPFDANFNRLDEQGMRNQYVGKNMSELQATIDSVNAIVDSTGNVYAHELRNRTVMGVPYYTYTFKGNKRVATPRRQVSMSRPVDIDSLFSGGGTEWRAAYITPALQKIRRKQQEIEYKSMTIQEEQKTVRRHSIELQKKFTLSFACIIFFFIGAPLGAIIRKGGLGMPIVISVLLFIFYYIIDNTGYKLARDGRWAVWEGMWLSSAVLLPLGIFLKWKAVNDSAVFNRDAYVNFLRKLIGKNQTRHYDVKEVIMDEVNPQKATEMLTRLTQQTRDYLSSNAPRQSYLTYWMQGYDRNSLHDLSAILEQTADYLSNSRDKLIVNKLMDYPVLRSLWVYRPVSGRHAGMTAAAIVPLAIPVWLIGRREQRILRHEMEQIIKVSDELTSMINDNTITPTSDNGKDQA